MITSSADFVKRSQTRQKVLGVIAVEINSNFSLRLFHPADSHVFGVRKVFFFGSLISGLTLGECGSSIKIQSYYFFFLSNAALNWVTADAFTKHFFSLKETESFGLVVPLEMREALVFRLIFNSVLQDVTLVCVCVVCPHECMDPLSNR